MRNETAMRELTRSCWSLDDIDARYRAFLQRFRPLLKTLAEKPKLSEKSAFIARTLLIQEYRKVLLRDPMLPPELLPANWQGTAAYQLCRNLYREVHARADAYLDGIVETADGPLPPATPAFMQRFGGLAESATRVSVKRMNELTLARRCAEKMWAGDKASQALGMTIEITAVGAATATMPVREDMVNGLNICHGGLLFALADTAFAFACNAYNRVTFAAAAHIDFLRPAHLGDVLCARATEEYRGTRRAYYAVSVNNQHGEVVALFRGRAASRDETLVSDKNDT